METQLLRALLLLGSVLLSHQRIEDTQVQVLHSWRFPDWIYPSESAKQNAIQQGLFIPQNCVILDSDYYFCKKSLPASMYISTTLDIIKLCTVPIYNTVPTVQSVPAL